MAFWAEETLQWNESVGDRTHHPTTDGRKPRAAAHRQQRHYRMTSQPQRGARPLPLETQNCPTRLTPSGETQTHLLRMGLHKRTDKSADQSMICENISDTISTKSHGASIIQMSFEILQRTAHLTWHNWDKESLCSLHTATFLRWVGRELSVHTLQIWKQKTTRNENHRWLMSCRLW